MSQVERTDPPQGADEAGDFPVSTPELGALNGIAGHESAIDAQDEVTLVAPTGRKSHLREVLVGIDALAFVAAWILALFVVGRANRDTVQGLLVVLGTTAIGLWLLSVQELYLARVSAIRSVELSRLTRAAGLAAVGEILLTRIFHVPARLTEALVGAALSLVFLITGRSVFRAYLAQARRNGRYCRRVVIVGASAEAADIMELIATHPEAGFRVEGVIGERTEALANGMAAQWLGPVQETFDVLERHETRGVIVVAGAIPAPQLTGVVRGLQERNVHIQLSSGLRGIDFRRLRANPIAYEPLFYLEAPVLARRQIALKRVIDLTLGVLGLILASPIILLTWILIKIEDRGPLFFKQVRIGRHGKPFTVYKFRTMVVDAEARLEGAGGRQRAAGPAVQDDPRSPDHPGRQDPAGLQPGRAAPAHQRRAGPDEPRRPPAGPPVRGGPVRSRAAGPPEGEARPDRSVAGRGPGQPLVRRLPPPRPLLRRELVGVAGPDHPPGHGGARHRPPGFVGVRAGAQQRRGRVRPHELTARAAQGRRATTTSTLNGALSDPSACVYGARMSTASRWMRS